MAVATKNICNIGPWSECFYPKESFSMIFFLLTLTPPFNFKLKLFFENQTLKKYKFGVSTGIKTGNRDVPRTTT